MAANSLMSGLPAEILINIFNNLKGNDLIKISSVCKNWNCIIGYSQMDKICIKANDNSRRGLKEVKGIFESTEREYKHISMFSVKRINFEDFETFGFKWKSVKISRSTIDSFNILKDFLMKLVATLEELDLTHLTSPTVFDKITIDLPRLKVLRCENLRLEADVLRMFECNINNLKELSVSYRSFSDDNYHIMQQTSQIQILRVSGTPTTTTTTINLNNFLTLKQEQLKEVQVDSMSKVTLQLIWNQLKCFKTITFGNADLLVNDSNFSLDQNLTVRKIYIYHLMQYSLLDKIIHASPNLKYIFTPTLQPETMHLVVDKLTKLQVLNSYKIENGNIRRVIKFKVYENTIDVTFEDRN